MLKPPPRKVVTKGVPKKVKSTLKTRSTGQIPSRWETIDSQNHDSQCSQSKSYVPKSKGARTSWHLLPLTSFDANFKIKTLFEYPIHFTNSNDHETLD